MDRKRRESSNSQGTLGAWVIIVKPENDRKAEDVT